MFARKTIFAFVFALSLLPLAAGSLLAAKKTVIVTTSTTLASIAEAVAQERASVESIASPKQNIHHYAPTPRDVYRVKRADVFIHEGLDLEAWRDPLLDAAGRLDFMWPGGQKQIDVSKGIELLEVPASLSREQGDIHVYGNPHYAIDPVNAKKIADNIAEGLAGIDPENAEFYRANADVFKQKLDGALKKWEMEMVPVKGSPVVTYHRSWLYFTKRFGLTIAGEIEPKPGIPPTAKHLAELIRLMKDKKIKIIIKEPFEESKSPRKIAEETNARVVILSQAVGEPKGSEDYFSLMDRNIDALKSAFQAGQGAGHE